jgi:hypothetical protein
MIARAATVNPKDFLCVGSDKAGDVWSFLNAFPQIETCVAIEYRGVPWVNEFREAFPQIDFLAIEGSSYSTANIQKVVDFMGGRLFDFMFIDGDKNAFDLDYAAYEPLVKSGGFVFMHDINPVHGDEGPVRFFAHLKSRGLPCEAIIDTSEVDDELALASAGQAASTSHAGWVRHWQYSSCGVGVVTR